MNLNWWIKMKLKPYLKYKDSGIQWIGEIPEGWEVRKIKHISNTVAGGTPSTTKLEYWDGNIPWLPSGMIHSNIIKEEDVFKYITLEGLNNSSTKKIRKNSPLIALTGATCGNVSYLTFEATANQSVVGIETNKEANPKYIFYHLLSQRKQILINKTGGAQSGINEQNVKEIFCSYPPLSEQTAIANFLDKETTRIDVLIEKDKKLIALLKERRTALINQAVTKGLDPNAKMKDSGIEWVGEIPEGWEVHKLKYKTIINKKKLEDDINPNCVINYLDISNVDSSGNILDIKEHFFEDAPSRARRIPRSRDTILSTVRTYLKAIAYLENIPDNLIVSTGFAVLEPIKSINSKYLFYSTSSEVFIQNVIAYSKGVAYPAINPPELGQIPIIMPLLSEQTTIVNFLDKATEKIDKTIRKIEEKIKLLEEYKKSLIHHVVTGKVDVREVEV